jgi:hypothetical protein
VNVLRLSLHPGGLAPQIENLAEWREHLLHRVRDQVAATGDPVLIRLLAELSGYAAPAKTDEEGRDYAGLATPLRLRSPAGTLSFISCTTVFGTPVDITLSELALETFFPADAETATMLRRPV